MKYCLILASFLVGSTAFADRGFIGEPTSPWFTGPLLTPTGHVVPRGQLNIEPYVFAATYSANYNAHWHAKKIRKAYITNFQVPTIIGLTQWMDIEIIPQTSKNRTRGVSTWVFNDLFVTLDFQLYQDPSNRYPSIKFYIEETFPTGRFQKLKADKFGTDIGGEGAFVTSPGLVFTQLHHLYGKHYFAWRFNPFFSYFAPVHVSGINLYGGAPNTRGTIHSRYSYSGLFGFEYSFTQNWVLAFDAYGYYRNKIGFSGRAGTMIDGSPANVGYPSAVQFSIAPALEYNFNQSLGVLGGAWFTVAGRNSPKFFSWSFALNYFGPPAKSSAAPTTGGGGSR